VSAVAKLKNVVASQKRAMGALSDGLESIRRDIRELQATRERIETRPPPIETAFKRVDEFITALRRPLDLDLASAFVMVDDYRPPAMIYNVDHFAVALGAETYREHLKAQLRKRYEAEPGIADAERAKELARIDGEILETELAEEALIRNAEAAGISTLRRRDASPAAVLAADEVFE
jgi:hypothetical protein